MVLAEQAVKEAVFAAERIPGGQVEKAFGIQARDLKVLQELQTQQAVAAEKPAARGQVRSGCLVQTGGLLPEDYCGRQFHPAWSENRC